MKIDPESTEAAADRLFAELLDAAPATVAGFVRPVLPPDGSGDRLGDRVGFGTPEGEAVLPRLRETPGDRLLPGSPGPAADAVKAGLLLLHGDLDGAHELGQRHEGTRDADAWHALVHRLEGDYGNSGYWWRRVGAHPAFGAVARAVDLSTWDPHAFTEAYRRATGGEERRAVRAAQACEFAALLTHGCGNNES